MSDLLQLAGFVFGSIAAAVVILCIPAAMAWVLVLLDRGVWR